MKAKWVCDGAARLDECEEHQAQLDALHDRIRLRYAAQWAKAGFLQRGWLRRRMKRDFRKERRAISPSPQALFLAPALEMKQAAPSRAA